MTPPRRVYFDHNATTPLDPGVREALIAALDDPWANPSSIHQLGHRARALLDDARERVADRLQCRPSEIIFTSGGTEANNLAVLGAARRLRDRGRHLLCSPIEHPAVLACHLYLARHEGFRLTLLPVDASGRIDPEEVARRLERDTVLVSVMAANNEVGTLQPVRQIGQLCRERGVLFHTDAVQWFGKEPATAVTDFEADLVTACAHKIHGPKGVGLLVARSPFQPLPLLLGGSQENDRRAGTENLAAILALTFALERFLSPPVFGSTIIDTGISDLRECLQDVDGVRIHSPPSGALRNTLAFTVADADSTSLLAALDLVGVCASSGSACSAGALEPSHVLEAMGVPAPRSASLVRFSLGRGNTIEEIDYVISLLPDLIKQTRSV